MGNSQAAASQRLSCSDGSPLLSFDSKPYRAEISVHISIITLIDIIMGYFLPLQQHLVVISDKQLHGPRLAETIGWILSDLPCRYQGWTPIGNNDVDGYRCIYGTLPIGWGSIKTVAIVNDRLYLFGILRPRDAFRLVSCLISDLLSSALSPTLPTSMEQVKSLIPWKIDHAAIPAHISTAASWTDVATCIWRQRLVIIRREGTVWITYEQYTRYHCDYYDTITDTWHAFATLSRKDGGRSCGLTQLRCIHDRLYVSCSYLRGHSPVNVYNEIDNKWIQLDAKLHPRHLLDCDIPLPLSSTQSNNSNDDRNNYLTVIQSSYGYERYDLQSQQFQQLKFSFPSWLQPQLIPLVVGNKENDDNTHKWLIWPTRHESLSYSQMALLHVNDINVVKKKKKKWRWWPALPSPSTHLVVSGQNGTDDLLYMLS
jgi:hypothetical protein